MATKGNTMQGYGYKQYTRQQRIQFPEEKFDLGMCYTNTPLTEGYVKTLINYDILESGASIKPRAGLHTVEAGVFPLAATTPIVFNDGYTISAGRDCVEANAASYRQVILGISDDTKLTGTNLYTGTGFVVTVDNASAADDLVEGIITKEIKSEPLQNGTKKLRFRRPEEASIHGMPVKDLGYIARQVGTFAFDNSFYYFLNSQELARTKLAAGRYIKEAVPIREITPKEAVLWGYNMLKANPYTFTNQETSGVIQFLGLLPYDEANNVIMSPQVNQTITLECFYSANTANKYKIYWDWKEPGGASWTTFKTEELEMTGLPEMKAEFSSPGKDIMIRVTAYKWDTTLNPAAYNQIAEKVLTVGFNMSKQAYGSTANIKVETYDLSTASGMTYWKNRLFVYGVAKDPTILFGSEINDPGYFPYPNNVDTFEEPIIYARPFLDNLLVFTTTKLYMLTMNNDGLAWTKKMIQGDLDIKEWDIHLIQVIKNMVFFKSGNYYYMVVPKKASTTGELTVAPISKPIEDLFDNFFPIIKEWTELLYDYRGDLDLVHYYNFLDFEDVHNIYVFETDKGVYLNADLLYNTINRNWRVHFYESQFVLYPYKQDATKKGTLVSLAKLNQRFFNPTELIQNTLAVQFYQFDELRPNDTYLPIDFKLWPANGATPAEIDDPAEKLELVHWIKNYQFLDAGYREHVSDLNKRYREVQLKFNNISQKNLRFNTEFSLDGAIRKSFYKWVLHHETDPADPDYGLIYMERVPIISEALPGSTVLGADQEDLGAWTLDQSMFPESILWKVRVTISGKGYAPKLRLISFNEERYELLNIIWVMRIMNSR